MKTDDKNMEFQILEAAEKLFVEQGYAKTTTGQIAELAGCNQALVHYYYRTKDNLFDKIFEQKIRLIVSNILKMDLDGISFKEKIVKTMEIHFDFLKQSPQLLPFIFNEIMSNPERIRLLVDKLQEYPKSVFTQLEPHLKKEIKNGNIRKISLIDLVVTIISLNAMPFLLMPIFQNILKMSDKDVQKIMKQRKQEAVETVLARLEP